MAKPHLAQDAGPSRTRARANPAGSQADIAGRRHRRRSSRAPAAGVGWAAGTEPLLNINPNTKIAVWRCFGKPAPLYRTIGRRPSVSIADLARGHPWSATSGRV